MLGLTSEAKLADVQREAETVAAERDRLRDELDRATAERDELRMFLERALPLHSKSCEVRRWVNKLGFGPPPECHCDAVETIAVATAEQAKASARAWQERALELAPIVLDVTPPPPAPTRAQRRPGKRIGK